MAEISAAKVKELREKTGAGMMDCKKALVENDGNLDGAVDWLRTKGLAAAQKKGSRIAAEGLVAVISKGTSGAAVEVNAETDFVARNEHFQSFVENLAKIAVEKDHTAETLSESDYPGEGQTVADEVTRLIATIGENMSLRRTQRLSVSEGVVARYVHNATKPGMGRIGVLVALESSADQVKLEELGKQLAMHIAATNPQSLDVSGLDPESVERERKIVVEQAEASGRPSEIIEKMVEGRIRKHYQEVVLLEQSFVIDGKTRVADYIEQKSKELGSEIKLTGYVRYGLGEGIDKKESDFAAEVQAQLAG